MKHLLLILTFAFLVACASDADEKEKSAQALKNDAIDDFIKVSELEPVDKIRLSGQMHHEVITQDYVFVRDRRNTWLVVFAQRCYDIDSLDVRLDVRHDERMLRARNDTIRGCRIQSIYPVTDGMVQEIEALTRPYE